MYALGRGVWESLLCCIVSSPGFRPTVLLTESERHPLIGDCNSLAGGVAISSDDLSR